MIKSLFIQAHQYSNINSCGEMLFKYLKANVYNISKSSLRFNHLSVMAQEYSASKEFKIDVPFGIIAGKIWNENQPKTPIVAVHGWMDNAGTWDHLCPLLKRDHPIIAIDAPGHGFSSPPPLGSGTYFTENLVTIHRALNHFKFEKVILLGHSMGGGASMIYSGTMSKIVQKLIVIDILKPISIEPEDQPSRTASALQRMLQEEEKLQTSTPKYTYDELVDKMKISYGGSLDLEAAKTLLRRGAREHEDGMFSFSYSPMLKVPGLLSMTFEQQKAFASNVTCDFLLIKAQESPLFSSKKICNEILEVYKKSSRNFVLEIVEGTHHVHLTNPEPVAALVNAFLDGNPQNDNNKAAANTYIKSLL